MLNIGIIGAGNIANKFSEAVNGSQMVAKLYGVASRSIEKAESFRKQHHIEHAYGSYKALLEDPQIDLVYIATPHTFHYEQMLMALDFDKHIICEKPFTINASLAEEIFQKAKEKNLFVMEAMWSRFLPVVRELKEMIDDGIIGELTRLEADFCFNPKMPPGHRLYQPKLGGGALLDVGIYPITFANLFMGKPTEIKSTVEMLDTGVDASETLTYHYPHGKAVLRASIIQERPLEARIFGSKGKVIVEGLHDTQSAKIYDNDGQLIKHIQIPHETNGFEYEIKDAIQCIEKGMIESQIIPHDETLSVLNQMDSIRASWDLEYPQEK